MTLANQKTAVDLEVRDTSSHQGTVVENIAFSLKTLIIENGLNQAATFQCKASAHADFSNSFNHKNF